MKLAGSGRSELRAREDETCSSRGVRHTPCDFFFLVREHELAPGRDARIRIVIEDGDRFDLRSWNIELDDLRCRIEAKRELRFVRSKMISRSIPSTSAWLPGSGV